jgi:predicted nucleic acid-binding protein
MTGALYDAGALIAADNNDRRFWADHKARLESGLLPLTTSPVVAQASRSPKQAQLRRLLRGCEIVNFNGTDAHDVGETLARSSTADVVDAHVAIVAARENRTVLTSDPHDTFLVIEV